ncbi:MAG TPA: PQQ-dependent sugar dehydrogenase [Candidatus Dormibacteraeota bacterium]|jgi:glucose/arabinose dehydrogenase/mono/diheme cytochrome c family protein|nr:PQQ-dependent sugar dehydrogenase [Candidatus Dormibacteraeota bacterium]
MKSTNGTRYVILVFYSLVCGLMLQAQNTSFHGAPSAAKDLTPSSLADGAEKGKPLYERYCASCHGAAGQGSGNVPSLSKATIKSVSPGELFWFISKGDPKDGMPSWEQLSETQRWQIVSYLKTSEPLGAAAPAPVDTETFPEVGPAPKLPFTDYRFEKPGQIHKITLKDLPAPFDTPSASNGPTIVPRPQSAWPKAPAGFEVTLYASGLDNPRRMRRAPNGDLFVAEVSAGRIRILRGIDNAGHPKRITVFAGGLDKPFGINFYPPGPDPRWVYVDTTTAVIRFPYRNGDLQPRGSSEHILDLPEAGHESRDIQVEPDGHKILISVGSFSNADDADNPLEKNRANILEVNPDGSDLQVYAYGIRNPSFMAFDPKTKNLWMTVNERDGLGDDLVPDYITHVQRGGFYGWPWWYMGGHQQPGLEGKHPELRDKVITPDVLLQPHNASVGIAFYDGKQFPAEFWGDIFAAEHGSWNRSVRTGYEVIRIPLHQSGEATGEYEDFLTGFVIDNEHVWGRPAGIAVGLDGSLFVADDTSNTIWRVKYVGH